MNRVLFHRAADRNGNTQYISARITLPSGKEYHVGYHPNIGQDGQRDGINFALNGVWIGDQFTETQTNNAIWLEDRNSEDMFCSEFFYDLTGKYPYELEVMESNADYAIAPYESILVQ